MKARLSCRARGQFIDVNDGRCEAFGAAVCRSAIARQGAEKVQLFAAAEFGRQEPFEAARLDVVSGRVSQKAVCLFEKHLSNSPSVPFFPNLC
jgi:hypothetical protein